PSPGSRESGRFKGASRLNPTCVRRERRRFHSPNALRCVSKHEGRTQSLVLILRDARTRVRICGTFSARALLRMRTTSAYSRALHTNSLSPSRGAFSAPEVCDLASLTPNEGGRSAESRSGAAAPVGRAHNAARQALARRLASHDAGRSPLGAPPWRFFTRGRASLTGIRAGSVTASSSQPGRGAWRAASRASRGQRLQAAAAGRHASLRIQDRL